MSGYARFLLPLMDSSQAIRQNPADPLEEEACLLQYCGNDLDWDRLSAQVWKTYGLPLLTSEEDINGDTTLSPASAGHRFIIADERFILEHPSLLPQFDRHGRKGQRPFLARPSLFSRWFANSAGGTLSTGEQSCPTADDSDSTTAFTGILQEIATTGASDWHLEPVSGDYLSRIRVHGQLCGKQVLTREKGQWLINSIIQAAGVGEHKPGSPLDGSFPLESGMTGPRTVRISLIPSTAGYACVARFLDPPGAPATRLEDLGLSASSLASVRKAFKEGDGLWLAAGPTGSGKSTTLRALLELAINDNEKVLAVEDPVERIIPGIQQVQASEGGMTFDTALRAFMRQSPDTILIGEVRDPDTASIAVQAALTGHRVLSTVHARSNEGIQRRFEDLGQNPELLQSACRKVLHQRLVPLLCPSCKFSHPLPATLAEWLKKSPQRPFRATYRARGCQDCRNGYAGRTGVFSLGSLDPGADITEVLSSEAINLLLSGKTDLMGILSYLPIDLRERFSFHNRKDFANYHSLGTQ